MLSGSAKLQTLMSRDALAHVSRHIRNAIAIGYCPQEEPSASYLSDCAEQIWKFWAAWGNLHELLYLKVGVLA